MEFAEAEALRSGALDADEARQIVRRRRRHWSKVARRPLRETINIAFSAERESGLEGQCASPGTVEGVARVARSLGDASRLETGEILIAPYTDPAWTPLFSKAGGVVVAMGSYLSHAGTIARELHVPCLVDVRDCMQLQSGQRVRLDATAGVLEVLP